jgi:hypothetical protein
VSSSSPDTGRRTIQRPEWFRAAELRKPFEIARNGWSFSQVKSAAEVSLDKCRQHSKGIARACIVGALLLAPEVFQLDFAVPPPLILEQLYGAVHAIESAAGAD